LKYQAETKPDPAKTQPDQEMEEVGVRAEAAKVQAARPAAIRAAVNERLKLHVLEFTTTIL